MAFKKILFIGGGNMAFAIVSGLLKNHYPAQQITVLDRNEHKRQQFQQMGVQSRSLNAENINNADVIILAIKPQGFAQLSDFFQENLPPQMAEKLLISLGAGINTTSLRQLFPQFLSVIRLMPNTPALVNAGMTGIFAPENITVEQKQFVDFLMKSVGEVLWLDDEQQMHALTAASGSSPAYFFLLMEAMQQSLCQQGLTAEQARRLIAQSALGAAKMASQQMDDFATLRQNITSKGGTTAAALQHFHAGHFDELVDGAIQACIRRSQEMEQSL